MPVIVRIDVDRPYGRQPLLRHVASRISSDYYLPTIEALGYLRELMEMLRLLKERGVAAHVFFRRCTLPTEQVLAEIDEGHHQVGLHLENSRSYETFLSEKKALEQRVRRPVHALSKHGSGAQKYGFHHYPPYEPDTYVAWAKRSGMTLVLGNLEDPTIGPIEAASGVTFYPAAFWLEPAWRDGSRFTVDWMIGRARTSDVVLLMHPENVFARPTLRDDFLRIVESCEPKVQA